MKKQTVSILILLLASSSFFFSCGNTMNKNTGALEFDSIQVNETAHLFGDTAKPGCNLVLNFAYATKSSDVKLQDSLNTLLLTTYLGDKHLGTKPQAAIKKYTQKYVSDYLKDLEPMYQKDEQEKEDNATMQAWYSYYKGIEGHVQLYTKNLLTYRIDYSEYTGGAHGIYSSTFINIDLRTLSLIRLEELFMSECTEELTDLLWNQLMTDNKVATHQQLQDMGYATTGDLGPTENFYLDKGGITFYYNVYEIAPYVMGPTKITLPYEAVQHLLNDNKEILNSLQ